MRDTPLATERPDADLIAWELELEGALVEYAGAFLELAKGGLRFTVEGFAEGSA